MNHTKLPVEALEATAAVTLLQPYAPLEQEHRLFVPTGCAAFHLCRKPQTLRAWASLENGPLRPVRINGRLGWSVADIKRLLKGGQ